MAKKIEGYIKLNIPAGGANPSPPVGPALGQRGVNIMEFCKAFNAATDSLEKNMPIPVVITVYQDKSFTFTTKTAPVSFFLKKAAGLNKGGQEPGRSVAGKVTEALVREIAEQKMGDMNAVDVDGAMAMVRGSARAMGLDVVEGLTMAKQSKRKQAALASVDRERVYPLADAVALVKANAAASKFDETIEVAMNLGVDPRHADQMVRGVVAMPNGTGKTMRVAVFARDAKADEAKEAGADLIGAEELAEAMQNGESNFDRVIATPDMMGVVGRLGKVLGPRGLMPNPKLGTVTPDVGAAVKAAKAGEVQYRAEKAGIVHAGVGKASFDQAKIIENASAFIEAVRKARPSGAKGTYIRKITLSSTMGVGVAVEDVA